MTIHDKEIASFTFLLLIKSHLMLCDDADLIVFICSLGKKSTN